MSGIQSHITIAFPVKSPADAKALADKLPLLMPAFAKAQDAVGSVHYSRFLALDETLFFIADIDGNIETLSGDLAKSAGPVFDVIFEHVGNPPPTPVADNSEPFIKWVKHQNIDPLVVYSAFENSSVQDIKSCARAAAFTGNIEQHPLLLSLPLKSTLKAFILDEVVLKSAKSKMNEGATFVGTLHFAHFVPLENHHLGFFTVFDGSFEKYIEDFTEKIAPVFDLLFEYVSDPSPTPVAKNPEAFLNYVAANDIAPIGFYSAYPGLAVQDIKALLVDAKGRIA